MSGADMHDFVNKNAQWATASLVYAVGTIALVWACLLPGLMLMALGAVLVGFEDEPVLVRLTLEILVLGLALTGPLTSGFVVFARSRKPFSVLSWKAVALASCLPILPGLILFVDTIVTDSYGLLWFIGPTMLAVFGAWIPAFAAREVRKWQESVRQLVGQPI